MASVSVSPRTIERYGHALHSHPISKAARRAVLGCAAWDVLRLLCLADRCAPPDGDAGLGVLPSLAIELVGKHVLDCYCESPLFYLCRQNAAK